MTDNPIYRSSFLHRVSSLLTWMKTQAACIASQVNCTTSRDVALA